MASRQARSSSFYLITLRANSARHSASFIAPSRCLREVMAKPAQKGGKNQFEFDRLQSSQPSNGPNLGISRCALHHECSRFEEPDLNRNLVLGPAKTGGVWNDGDQRSIQVTVSHADDESGTYLLRHSEIEYPNLTASGCHALQLRDWRRADPWRQRFPHRPVVRSRMALHAAGIPR